MSHPDDSPTESMLDARYLLGERIGRGGMADVYRAEDVLLGRQVAVKLIRPGVDGVATPERARGEVSALASLNHPSLVTLLDARLDDTAQEYLVMELVEGPTLSQLLRESALAPDEVAHLAAEIAEALHVVHAAGIVHRDIKPSNVLLTSAHLPGMRFHAKLADFGIAYLVDSTHVTTPGQVIGTAAYLAPEQVEGGQPAPPTDVYALGLVLLEALTGAPAFPHAGGIATALARLNSPPDIPSWLGPRWTDLLERMTRLDAAARPTALEVAVEAPKLVGTAGSAAGAPTALLAAATPTLPIVAGAPTVPLAAGAATVPAGLAGASDAATRVYPVAAAAATPPAGAAATPPDGTAAGRPDGAPRRRRKGLLVGASAVGVAAVLAAGLWSALVLTGSPTPATTERAVTEPTSTPTETTAPEPAATPVTVVDPSGPSEEDRKAAERAQKEQEQAQKRAEQEAEKQAREAQRQAEDAQREAERAAEEEAEEADEQGDGAPAPGPSEPAPAPPAQPEPSPVPTTPITGTAPPAEG